MKFGRRCRARACSPRRLEGTRVRAGELNMADAAGRLAGKSAVVTGAAAGIGKATAIEFARQGARLVGTDINPDPLRALRDALAAGGAKVVAVTGDVSIEAHARAMIRAAIDAYGRL